MHLAAGRTLDLERVVVGLLGGISWAEVSDPVRKMEFVSARSCSLGMG